uniref:Carbohydrate deacetylase n=1 Tax=Poecilia latipinna TaxID=48699 RepID=A0A3B3VBU9_9TELE
MPLPRLLMVVTGDDFGYCPRRNQGIVDCFLAGGISNVSLLVNASAAKEAADLAGRHKIPIGLHANLSEGTPVYQHLQQISTLVNPQGFFHGKMGFRQALEKGQLSMNQVELELRAQVRRFIELTGHLPHHMDGHQHVHVLPDVREVFAQVLSDVRIPFTRVPIEPGLHNCPWVPAHLHTFYMEVEKDALDSIPVFKHYGIRYICVFMSQRFKDKASSGTWGDTGRVSVPLEGGVGLLIWRCRRRKQGEGVPSQLSLNYFKTGGIHSYQALD